MNYQTKIMVQIATGGYTYNKNGQIAESHSLYALDEYGKTYKWIVTKKLWVLLEDIDANYND